MSDDGARSFSEAKNYIAGRIDAGIARGSQVGADLDKTLISLSAGALVFSMTFVGQLAPSKLLLPVLFAAWVAFAISIICVVLAMRAEQNAVIALLHKFDADLKKLEEREVAGITESDRVRLTPTVDTAPWVVALNRYAVGTFMLGLFLLGTFVAYNLWRGH